MKNERESMTLSMVNMIDEVTKMRIDLGKPDETITTIFTPVIYDDAKRLEIIEHKSLKIAEYAQALKQSDYRAVRLKAARIEI